MARYVVIHVLFTALRMAARWRLQSAPYPAWDHYLPMPHLVLDAGQDRIDLDIPEHRGI